MILSGNLILSTKQDISNKILMNNTLHYSQNTAPQIKAPSNYTTLVAMVFEMTCNEQEIPRKMFLYLYIVPET